MRRPAIPSGRTVGSVLLALACGACGADATSGARAPQLGAAPPAFDAGAAWSRLERVVAFGPRPAGSPGLDRLRDWLAAELVSFGLRPERERFRRDTPIGAIDFENVWAELPGRSPRTIVLASHIDTKRLPFAFVGASDGGSSTAVLLELARLLAQGGPRALTYRFLFLDGEESIDLDWVDAHALYGSRHHAQALQEAGALGRIGAVVVLDLVGDADLRLERDTNSHQELLALFVAAAQRMGRADLFARYRRPIQDDHVPFARAGVPALDLIDLDYGPGNEYWHGPGDVLEHCSPASLDAVGRLVLAALDDLERWVQERSNP